MKANYFSDPISHGAIHYLWSMKASAKHPDYSIIQNAIKILSPVPTYTERNQFSSDNWIGRLHTKLTDLGT